MSEARKLVMDALWEVAGGDPKLDGVPRDDEGARTVLGTFDSMAHVEWAIAMGGMLKAAGVDIRLAAPDMMAWAKDRGLKNPFLDADSMTAYIEGVMGDGCK